MTTDRTGDGNALPEGIELTALADDFRADPYAILARLRREAPLYLDPTPRRYFVTRHDDVKALLHDKQIYMDPRKAKPGTYSRDIIAGSSGFADPPDMLFLDDPDHHRLRSLVSAPFRPARVEQWRADVRALVDATLDGIEGPEFDLVAEFAAPVPVAVIARMLGIDESLHGNFKTWSDTLVMTGFNPFPTEEQVASAQAARVSLDGLFEEQIVLRSRNPGPDLISAMLRAEDQGETLTRAEMIDQCRLLLVAGNVTTTDLISNGVRALLDHPAELQKLRDDPTLIANAVEEMLRFDSPVTNSSRVTDRGREIQGCPVDHGESLHLSLAAANRDPDRYPEPDRFDIERADTGHLAFGGGRHLCLGAHLARMEAQEAINGLLRRFPDLAHSDRGYRHHGIPAFRGMESFWVRAGTG